MELYYFYKEVWWTSKCSKLSQDSRKIHFPRSEMFCSQLAYKYHKVKRRIVLIQPQATHRLLSVIMNLLYCFLTKITLLNFWFQTFDFSVSHASSNSVRKLYIYPIHNVAWIFFHITLVVTFNMLIWCVSFYERWKVINDGFCKVLYKKVEMALETLHAMIFRTAYITSCEQMIWTDSSYFIWRILFIDRHCWYIFMYIKALC